jgi:hypothetical protein
LVSDELGLASAKQIFLPPGEAAYAPHTPYWPISFGWAPPATAAAGDAGLAVVAGAAGFASGFTSGLGFGFAGVAA